MYVHYIDIDECLIDNGGCESSCTNLEGINNTTGLGYQCGCDNGYQLAPNNHNCTGMYCVVIRIRRYVQYLHALAYMCICFLCVYISVFVYKYDILEINM